MINKLAAYEQSENTRRNQELSKLTNPVKHLDLNGNDQISIIMNHQNENSSSKPSSKNTRIFVDPISSRRIELQEIHRSSFKRKNNFFREYYQNVIKLLVCSIRDPQQTIFRLMNSIVFPIVLHITVTGEQAKETGCTFLAANSTHILNENMYERYDRQLKGIQGNVILMINYIIIG